MKKPVTVTDPEVAFGRIDGLLPSKAHIPKEFHEWSHPYTRLASEFFLTGAMSRTLIEKPGIDRLKALRHCTAILRSYEPQHEHKIAGVGYLLSQWFEIKTGT